MADDSGAGSRWGATPLLAIAAVVVVGFVVAIALPGPPPRKYPRRQPVRLWHMWSAQWKEVVEDICDRFNASQDTYEVIPLSVPGQTADYKFPLAVAGGDPPDVMTQWNPVIPKWADNGLLVPLNGLMTPQEWDDFQKTAYPIARKIGMYKGNLYGVAVGLNLWGCYYRPDHLRAAGLDPDRFPESMEELQVWTEKLNLFDSRGSLTRIGFMEWQWSGYAALFGGGLYDWENDRLTLDTPENLRALAYLADQRKKLGFDNVMRYQSGLRASGIGGEWPLISGDYSIVLDGQWNVENIGRYAPTLEYRTAPVPPPRGGKRHAGYSNGNFMIIPRGARNIAGAWEFIKFWSGLENPQRAAEFYTWGGWLPLNPAIAQSPIYLEYLRKYPQFKTFVDMMPSENIHAMPPVPYQLFLGDRILQAEDAAVRGSLTPGQAMARLVREVEQEQRMRKQLGYEN